MENFGNDEALRILDAGWRQGSVFTANGFIGEPHGFEPGQRLIVLTQSCTVVSSRIDNAPHVEVAAVKPVSKYNERSREAKGRNLSRLQIPIAGEVHAALEIDLNSRTFVPRFLLLDFAPDGVQPEASEGRRIGGWISRYYSRIALPNALVEILREGCLEALESVLKAKLGDVPLDERVSTIFIDWDPDDESGGPYEVEITLLTDDQEAAEFADGLLGAALPAPTPRLIVRHEVLSADLTRIAEVEDRIRFTEYDYLSDLTDEAVRI